MKYILDKYTTACFSHSPDVWDQSRSDLLFVLGVFTTGNKITLSNKFLGVLVQFICFSRLNGLLTSCGICTAK